MRAAGAAFSGFSSAPRKASWDELSRERESDGETKNYAVPPELIELARANRKGRGQVGTLTPLAPKPSEDVVVVVPAATPLAIDLAPVSSQPESALQAPSVPVPHEASSEDPESARTAVYGAGQVEAALFAEASAPVLVQTSPLAEMMRSELAAAAGESELQPREEITSVRPARRSSRRVPRSLRVEMPVETAIAARAASQAQAPRAQSYRTYATGAALVGCYIVLCYYVNALLAGMH